MTTDVLTWSNPIEDNEQKDQDNTEVMHPEKPMLKVRNQWYQTIRHTTEQQSSVFSATGSGFSTNPAR